MPEGRHRSLLLGGQELALMADTERPRTTQEGGIAELSAQLRTILSTLRTWSGSESGLSLQAVETGADVHRADGFDCVRAFAPLDHPDDPLIGWLFAIGRGSATDTRRNAGSTPTAGTAGSTSSTDGEPPDDDPETTRVVALVDLAKRGDAEAFGQLYDHYVTMIYRYVYYRVGGHALAEDLTSETFLRALRSLSMFKWQGRDFGAWLVTIARNLVADHYKSGRFRLEITSGEILDHDSVTEGPENDVLASLTNQALLAALQQLGGDQQECLVLRFLNGLTVAETARSLGKSEGAVKQLQLRAIRNLAKQLPDGFR